MVSIPDWSKFSRLNEGQNDSQAHLNKYYKQREEDAVRQAEEQGYFLNPTKEWLVKSCGPANGRKIKDVTQLKYVRLVGIHVRKIGDLNLCLNLTICILNNNFLTKIDGLADCRQLYKLDLHSNQIATVPGIAFWSGLRKLRVLHLHDNPLGRYEILQNLATCPSLLALTLFDTPISIKRNYRHHVVNSIWSLKALDYHVISDEEIIEDALFGGKFGALSQAFKIDLCPYVPESSSYDDEVNALNQLERKITDILAHYSPVIIVQRIIRGYLARKSSPYKLKSVKKKSGLLSYGNENVVTPPPTTPATAPQIVNREIDSPAEFAVLLRNNRPDSSALSDTPPISIPRVGDDLPTFREPNPSPITYTQTSSPDGSPRKKKNLLINLAKLQNGTFQSLYDEAIAIETVLPEQSEDFMPRADSRKKIKKKKKLEEKKDKKSVKSVKQFFGPVVDTVISPEQSFVNLPDIETEVPVTQFRLQGLKPKIQLIDPLTEMLLERRTLGRFIRDAETEHHKVQDELPKPRITPRKNINTDQRIFARVHGTMGLSCLYAVHQAYKDRTKAEKVTEKMERILGMKEERERAKERIKLYKEEKRTQVLKCRDQEKSRLLDGIEKKELQRVSYIEKRYDLNNKSADVSKSHRADFGFITEFNTQHTSVSNALLRHDRQARFEDVVVTRADNIQSLKSNEQEQQSTVKKYLEHRKVMRQTETAMARAALDTRMLQEANERIMQVKSRVAHQKACAAKVQAFYPLPPTVTLPVGSSSVPTKQKLSHWDASAKSSAGRVGRHQTLVM